MAEIEVNTEDTLFGRETASTPQIDAREIAGTKNQTVSSNVPIESTDSAEPVKTFFDKYFVEPISLPAGEIDAVIGFFDKRGFDKTAATNISTILLAQARLDAVPVFRLLDTLKGISDAELSNIVTEILNVNRSKISTLGFKVENTQNQFEKRNIVI
jgi:hypothetical protein